MADYADLLRESWFDDEAIALRKDICKTYEKYGDHIELVGYQSIRKRYIFEAKLKGNTREANIRAHESDVKLRLKLPLFRVVKRNLTLYIMASLKEPDYSRLPKILDRKFYQKASERQWLPYVVGYDSFGKLVILDVDDFPHLLMGGSSGSGKSVGLQALVLSLAFGGSADDVNFILMDLGATDLRSFEGLPQLSCPVIQDRSTALHALEVLVAEMDRRINLKFGDPDSYEQLPRLVLVIDEFPALFTGAEKAEVKQMADMISSLLQRGRHAQFHLVLAAQNPTFPNMRVDLSNITARAAFKCAKKNFSETILGEGGAENLSGNGEMLLKAPGIDGVQWLQGVYIKPWEVDEVVRQICGDPWYWGRLNQAFVIPEGTIVRASATDNCGWAHRLPCPLVSPKPTAESQLFAKALLWTLRQDFISANKLKSHFHLGWDRASWLIAQLEALGVVDKPDAKLPRHVIPTELNDLPNEMLAFLEENGIENDAVCRAFQERNGDISTM